MNNLENWQPLFRFLEQIDNSSIVGLIFMIFCLVGVFIGWYWVCFKDGAKALKADIVSMNKRLGINLDWWPPLFLLKVFASILLCGFIFGVFVAFRQLKS